MRVLVLSDLHLEVWRGFGPKIDVSFIEPDVVVLAGDIHTLAKGVGWAADTFLGIPVLYVAGNHEYYGGSIEKVNAELKKVCASFSNVHYLDCDEYILGNVRFLGATLWTDYLLFGPERRHAAMVEARHMMNDYQRIRVASAGYRKFSPEDSVRLHGEHQLWLSNKLDEAFAGRTVVITHMAPSAHSVTPQYAVDLISAAFASNSDSLVSKADFWIHGHTHTSFDYYLGKCRVVANPLGYQTPGGTPENSKFDSNFIVEVS